MCHTYDDESSFCFVIEERTTNASILFSSYGGRNSKGRFLSEDKNNWLVKQERITLHRGATLL